MINYNWNRVLDFPEFMSLVRTHELAVLYPKLNMMMRTAAFVVVPRNERTDVVKSGIEDYKCCPPPILMPLLSLIEVLWNCHLVWHKVQIVANLLLQVGVFIYYAVEMGGVGPNGPVPFKSLLIYDPYRRYEAWRFFSYMLIHSG